MQLACSKVVSSNLGKPESYVGKMIVFNLECFISIMSSFL